MTPTTAVLLAAGAGTRLGRGPKALLPFRGGTLVEHAAQALRDGGCTETVVVAGAGADQVAALQSGHPDTALAAARVVVNDDWALGMGGSFRLGVAAAGTGHDVLVSLVDQPGVTAELVARLLAAHRPGRITAAGYAPPLRGSSSPGPKRGHPIIFSASLAAAAAASSTGDAGARLFLAAHPELIDVVNCSDLADGADVDTPQDLHLLKG